MINVHNTCTNKHIIGYGHILRHIHIIRAMHTGSSWSACTMEYA